VNKNDLILNITFAWEGAIAIAQSADTGALVSHRFPTYVFNLGVALPEFYQYRILNKRFIYDLGVISPGGAGRNRVLNKTDFLKLKLAIPELKEQQKIAECLGSLDGLITAEGRKLAALRDHKRGLMQQLFPQPGQTQPRLRFPEFRDKGEWEEKALGDICNILNNRRVPISSSDRTPGPYPYYGASGVVDFVDDYIFDERLVLIGEDGAKWKAFEETAFIAEGQYWVNNHAHVLKPSGVIDTLLSNYLTMIDVGGYVTGNAPPKLTLAKLKTIPVPVSRYMKEQQRVAECLSSLDGLIAAEGRALEALRDHKRGLMQQLFPAPEEQ
jgi:type I restriction enzyme, S subunit